VRRRKALATLVVLVVILASLSLALIYVHDNPVGLTPISSINTEVTPIGSNVTIKGEITSIIFLMMGPNDQVVSISDGSGSVEFFWTKTRLDVGWIILVRGTVYWNYSIHPVSSVDQVLLFL
jgi:hypothetical protein